MAPVFTLGPQATSLKTRLRIRFSASGHLLKRCSEPRPGSATHGYKKSEYETTTQVSQLPDEGKWDGDVPDTVGAPCLRYRTAHHVPEPIA